MNSGRRLSLDRLRGRSVAELRFRAMQAGAVLLERAGVLDSRELSSGEIVHLLSPGARARHATINSWVRALRERGGKGFHGGLDDPYATAALASRLDPRGHELVLDRAERALDGRLDLLGFRDVRVGSPIDWHRDPVAGIHAPPGHWSTVPYLDPAVTGDHKCTWEVNRHQWLVTLAQAWVVTGDARYATAVDQQLRSWMDANPPKQGMNWASSLEVGFRAIAWLWTLRLLATAAPLRDDTCARAVGHLVLSARHLVRNLSTYFSPNTHLTGEALALYHLGVELSDLREAASWRGIGRSVLLGELPHHVRPDGTYFEQSTWYHRYTLDFYAHFALLAARHGEDVAAVRDAVGRLGRVLAAITRPNGTFPLIGDDDGGRLLFLDGRAGTDARPALALAGAVSGDGWLLARADEAVGDVAWLMGTVPSAESANAPPTAQRFAAGGLVVLRSGWGDNATLLALDAGPHGALNCGHAHADALSFDLTVRGTPIFVDPGTGRYTTDSALRDRLRATTAHNAATVGGRSSSRMRGPFAWESMASTSLDAWSPGTAGTWLRGSHDGYEPAASYGREVFFHHGGWLVIRDSWKALQVDDFAVLLQCAAGLSVEKSDRRLSLVAGGVVVAMIFAPDAAVTVEDGEVSPAYGLLEPAPRLRIAANGEGAVSVTTLISPPNVVRDVHWEGGRSGRSLIITSPSGTHRVGFGDFTSQDMQLEIGATAWWTDDGGTYHALGIRHLRRNGQDIVIASAPHDRFGRMEDS